MNSRFLTSCARIGAALALAWIAELPLAAEPAADAPPQAPYVAPLPDRLQWSVIIKTAGEEAPNITPDASAVSPWAPVRVDSVKFGIYRHAIETFHNGQKRDYWFAGEMMLDFDSSGKNVMVVDYKALQKDFAISVGDPQVMAGWEAFSWINLGAYRGLAVIGKEPCHHYVLDGAGTVEAWISVRTKFPLVYRFHHQTYLFQYGPTPTDLPLPPEYQKSWSQYQDMATRARFLQNSGDR